MALTTAILVILLAATVFQLQAEAKSKDIPMNEWWKIDGYLKDR